MIKQPNLWNGTIDFKVSLDERTDVTFHFQLKIKDIIEEDTYYREIDTPNTLVDYGIEKALETNLKITGLRVHNIPITRLTENTNKLKDLQSVELFRTNIEEFPKFLHKNELLEKLTLFESEIEEISEEIKFLKKLRSLNIFKSKLTEIPESLFECQNLEYLGLPSNFIEHIPSNISRLDQLKKLDLYNNTISDLPKEIANLRNLKVLWLHGNLFTAEENQFLKSSFPDVELILGKPVNP